MGIAFFLASEHFQAGFMSVYRALKLRGLNPTKAIADALKTNLTTGQLPPLPDRTMADI